MSRALEVAQCGRGTVSPNPMVGCVIVKNNQIVGEGFHQYAGGPHAEIIALQQAKHEAKDAIVYVSLEPCCHHGKTPPCTQALIDAGVKTVYASCLDPNPKIAGKGIKQLQAAGINTLVGLHEPQAKQINEIFFHYMTHKRPFVIAKWAMSLDGKTVTHQGDSRDISSLDSRQYLHQFRQEVDAILVGAKTAVYDNPLLTVRHASNIKKHPIRIVLTSRGHLPTSLNLFDTTLPSKTIVATTNKADKTWIDCIKKRNIEVIILPENENGHIDLPCLLDALGQKEITSLLVEGGNTIHQSFFRENLINKVHVYLAPVIIGSLEKKQSLSTLHVSKVGCDFFFTGEYRN
jgi:diaminohydroxyphosphoribosylaminopyrimidine deaminase/5-amino-6-(5-phosphoribosylamino)uracil reductase